MSQINTPISNKGNWHILKWYKENFGVDPLMLGLPYVEQDNPYSKKAAPMKLWEARRSFWTRQKSLFQPKFWLPYQLDYGLVG